MTSIAALNQLLEKTADWDKDERYMATNDLCNALNKDIKIDEKMEQRICAAVLKQLDDQSNDVQSVAVKCLAIITRKVQQAQISDVCKKLCSLILDGNDALRDVYSIGLKTLIADVPDSMGTMVTEQLTAKLLSGISRQSSEDIQRECLDNMTDLLRRFGHLNTSSHNEIMKSVVKQLQNDRAVIRKRAAHCLGALVVVSSDALLNSLMQILLEGIEASAGASATSQSTRTLIQTIGTISRTVGYRLGKHLERVVPLFLRFCGDPNDESQQTDAANELRESCFPGLESFVLRCPREVAPFLDDVLKVAVSFMRYDPNYSYDSEEEEGSGNDMSVDGDGDDAEEEEEEDYGEDEDGGGSDDDDTSWKVRKAAVKVIHAVVQARPDLLTKTWSACGMQLVRRFKEREENVRLDVLGCFTSMVQASYCSSGGSVAAVSLPPPTGGLVRQRSTSGDFIVPTALQAAPGKSSSLPELENAKIVHSIFSACSVQLTGTSVKSKSAVFVLLRALVAALHGGLDRYLPKLMGLVEKCLADKQQALRLDALAFLRTALELHSPSVLQPNLLPVLNAVVQVVSEDGYKVVAEALRVLTAMVPVLRPVDASSGFFVDNFSAFKPCAHKIYQAVMTKMEALDIDHEIKECAILAMGVLFSHAGDELSSELPGVLGLFKRRLENETTRSSTLKALAAIAQSSLRLDLSEFMLQTAGDLALFLRQSSRSLKQLTLTTLAAIVSSSSTQLVSAEAEALLGEASALINETDLHLSHLSLQLTSRMLEKNATICGPAIHQHVYPRMLELARSSLVQGAAQTSLIQLFRALVQSALPGMSYTEMFPQMYVAAADMNKQSLANLSKCVAAISCAPDATELSLQRFVADLQSPSSDDSTHQLALLCLGEVGQAADLSAIANLKELVLACFESKSEDTKLAAAFALGHIAVGNMGAFLPLLLQQEGSSKRQYLLLAALKDMVVVFAHLQLDFLPHLPAVLPVLLQQCKSEEESVRTIVAECLGVLTTMLPDHIVPVLLQLSEDEADKLSRRMIGNALRCSLSRSTSSPAALQVVAATMHRFLPLLQDSDLDVKRAALLMVNTAVHHNLSTVEEHLGTVVIPALIETLQIKLERTVDLGPFKHRVDDNMPLRKISLTCLETILDTAPDRLDVASLTQVMPIVLADKDELKSQAHQILAKLCVHSPALVVGVVEQLIAPLTKTIAKKPVVKDEGVCASATGPEAERALELVRSGVRAVLAVSAIEDIAQINRKWADFAEKVRKDEFTSEIVLAIEAERALDMY